MINSLSLAKYVQKRGIKNVPMNVATSIPPMTPVPMACRLAAPAPLLIARGNTPILNARDVITIGRNLSLAASTADSIISKPSCSRLCCANSTIKIAFFAARAISVISPIWK